MTAGVAMLLLALGVLVVVLIVGFEDDDTGGNGAGGSADGRTDNDMTDLDIVTTRFGASDHV